MLLFEFVEELRWEMGVMVRMVDLRLELEFEESFVRILLFELLYELLYELQLQELFRVWKEDVELFFLEILLFVIFVGLFIRELQFGFFSMESFFGEAIGVRFLDFLQMIFGMSVRARDIRLEEELDVDSILLFSDDRLLRMDKLFVLEFLLIIELLLRLEFEFLGSLLVSGCVLFLRNNLIDFFRKFGMKSRVRRLESFFILRIFVVERVFGLLVFIGLYFFVLKLKVNRLIIQVIEDIIC